MFSRLLIYFLKKPAVAKVIQEIVHPPRSDEEIRAEAERLFQEHQALLKKLGCSI